MSEGDKEINKDAQPWRQFFQRRDLSNHLLKTSLVL
jgi:hypothetical protein